LPRYEARRILPAPVEDVWEVLADPERWPDWLPGLVDVTPTVRRALAPGALWQLEGTDRASFRRRPQLGGALLFLEVVPLQRISFQLTGERVEVELDFERTEDDARTGARLSADGPRFGGLGRTFPSQALARLAALVRPPDE
jgi:uncharacterized protein YndB with AHSA1/START domain